MDALDIWGFYKFQIEQEKEAIYSHQDWIEHSQMNIRKAQARIDVSKARIAELEKQRNLKVVKKLGL